MLTSAGKPDDPSRIIVMSSVAGTNVSHVGDNGTIMYSASKAAAHHLARNLAVELGVSIIRVRVVLQLANLVASECNSQHNCARILPFEACEWVDREPRWRGAAL